MVQGLHQGVQGQEQGPQGLTLGQQLTGLRHLCRGYGWFKFIFHHMVLTGAIFQELADKANPGPRPLNLSRPG